MSSTNTSILRRHRLALAGVAALAVGAAPLAGVASANAAARPAAAAGSSSLITIAVSEPAHTEVFAGFTGGLGTITEQNIVGDSLAGATTTPSSFGISALDATNNASDFMLAQTTPGTPITGTATLPAGATMTASVNGGPSVAITNGSFSIPVAGGLGGAQDPTPSIHVSPNAVRAGSNVKVFGIAPTGSKPGAKLTLVSSAFASKHKVSGLPAVTTRVRAGGSYSATPRIAARIKPSTYGVTGKVGNRYLQVAALKVRG